MRYDLNMTKQGGLSSAVDIGQVLGRLEADLTDAGTNTGLSVDTSEAVAALRLAMLAMSEAEQRIERQQKRIRKLESLSSTDELTGLHNRRGFHQELKRALAQANRTGAGGILMMIDLDRFKAVNDTHGHAAGDAILKAVAKTLKASLRETDGVSRLGGDEFAVVLPATEADEADSRLAALRAALDVCTVSWNGKSLPVHASIGHAVFAAGDDLDSVLDRADRRMYDQKARNRVARAS